MPEYTTIPQHWADASEAKRHHAPRRYFITEYRLKNPDMPDGSRYSTYLLAHDIEEAKALIELRQKGEILLSNGRPLQRRGTPAVPILCRLTRQLDRIAQARLKGDLYAHRLMHAVMHCSDLATASGRWRIPSDAMADNGLYHQLTHLLDAGIRKDLLMQHSNIEKLRYELALLEEALPEMFRREIELKRNLPKE